MRARFIDYYERELEHLYGAARSLGAKYPANAARLGLDRATPLDGDPFVKQLVEGVAFLAARLESRIDDVRVEHARQLLEIVRPGALAPRPACLIARVEPRASAFSPAPRLAPVRVPAGQALRARSPGVPECRFTTTAPVELWPLECAPPRCEHPREHVGILGRERLRGATHVVALDAALADGFAVNSLAMDSLTLHLDGDGDSVQRVLQALHLSVREVRVVADGRDVTARAAPRLEPVGFDPDEALFGDGAAGFDGDRLVRELFAFRRKFEFVRVAGLAPTLRACPGERFTLAFVLEADGGEESLARRVARVALRPFCTPAVNLFERELLPLTVEGERHEHLLVADRTAPASVEIHTVTGVQGRTPEGRETFTPYYSDGTAHDAGGSFYALERRSSALLERSDGIDEDRYAGTELWLSLLDAGGYVFDPEARLTLDVRALCTNRHLPSRLEPSATVLEPLEGNGYVNRVALLGPVTAPHPARTDTAGIWPLVGLLTRHYRSLDVGHGSGEERAAWLRSTLRLLAGLEGEAGAERQLGEVERQGLTLLRGGLVALECRAAEHAIETGGLRLPVRGLDVDVTLDVDAFPGRATWTFAAVLARYLERQVGLNTTIALTVLDAGGRELMRWTPTSGRASLG